MLLAQRLATKPAKRKEMLIQLQRRMATDLPYLPMYWQFTALAVSNRYVYRGFNAMATYQAWSSKNVRPR
jgi:ABC-type transport system substrate-binding protein